ncbi:hypothetical protein CPB84DRAFT_1651766, partial [Gymnopilus junonius]
MMRDLTSLHATMAAANKVGSSRGSSGSPPTSAGLVKQEEMGPLPMQHHHPRPGTSTGYEGEMSYSAWQVSGGDRGTPTHPSHSFRDPGQSFLVPPAAAA